ncbi:MAG: QueG-associated DUF1730 domain-containing protein [Leptospirales bacterium]
MHTRYLNTESIQREALQEGFSGAYFLNDVGVSEGFQDFYNSYLKTDNRADLHYLENTDVKFDASKIFSGVKSIGVFPFPYYNLEVEQKLKESNYKIARYAWGRDYHKSLKSKLKKVCKDQGDFRVVCDSTPLPERYLAAKAMGESAFVGRNGMLLDKRYGSYFLLAFVLFERELQPAVGNSSSGGKPHTATTDEFHRFKHCGECRKCIDACPGNALNGDGTLAASKCFSYWSTSNRSAQVDLKAAINRWVFGCDICQEVCPYNKEPVATLDSDFSPRNVAIEISKGRLDFKDDELYGTVFQRLQKEIIQRNKDYVDF